MASALLLCDLQRDFMAADGVYARHGLPVGRLGRIVEPTARAADACRAAGLPIFASRFTIWESPAGQALGLDHLLRSRPFLAREGFRLTDAGRELIAELPRPDYTVDKPRFSAFHGTPLESLLRSLGVDTLVLAGIATNGGVEATARDAMLRDFSVVVLEDCVAALDDDLHRASLRSMGLYLTVTTSARFLSVGSATSRTELRP